MAPVTPGNTEASVLEPGNDTVGFETRARSLEKLATLLAFSSAFSLLGAATRSARCLLQRGGVLSPEMLHHALDGDATDGAGVASSLFTTGENKGMTRTRTQARQKTNCNH